MDSVLKKKKNNTRKKFNVFISLSVFKAFLTVYDEPKDMAYLKKHLTGSAEAQTQKFRALKDDGLVVIERKPKPLQKEKVYFAIKENLPLFYAEWLRGVFLKRNKKISIEKLNNAFIKSGWIVSTINMFFDRVAKSNIHVRTFDRAFWLYTMKITREYFELLNNTENEEIKKALLDSSAIIKLLKKSVSGKNLLEHYFSQKE